MSYQDWIVLIVTLTVLLFMAFIKAGQQKILMDIF